jgi:uncharacterized protein YfiM (DUF2279 family)
MATKCNDLWTGKDKIKHLVACIAIAVVHPVLGVLAAIIKEGYDATKEGNHWCWKDIVADIIGVAVGSGVHFLIFWWLL